MWISSEVYPSDLISQVTLVVLCRKVIIIIILNVFAV